jgi:type II secretory ATPase GspE/PulE/Tfp pilus assembly ATPase PilB-like protein
MPDTIINQAIEERATDIHIEPGTQGYRIRFRIDGLLSTKVVLDIEEGKQLSALIKVKAGMDIAQRMLPQDGSLHWLATNNEAYDIRVASQPSILGEVLALRLLPAKPLELDTQELGMSQQMAESYARLLKKGHGLVLVAGPTGSGKTTTLYAGLSLLDPVSSNIMTLEDPVEYRLPEIIQTQVNYRGGLTFAAGLKGILRQDPDVVLVGEIRDPETAAISVRAALTGHLVLATLHAMGAVSAVTRLLELGCAPYQVAPAIAGVVAQRLVRRPCPCKAKCPACKGTGYYGRIGVFELLSAEKPVRHAILNCQPLPLPKPTLLDDCRYKVKLGLTDHAQLERLSLALEGEE